MEENPESKKLKKLNVGVTRRGFLQGFAGALTKAVTPKVPVMEKVTTCGASADPRLLEPLKSFVPVEVEKVQDLFYFLDSFNPNLSLDTKLTSFMSGYDNLNTGFQDSDFKTLREVDELVDEIENKKINMLTFAIQELKQDLEAIKKESGLGPESYFIDLKEVVLKKQLNYVRELSTSNFKGYSEEAADSFRRLISDNIKGCEKEIAKLVELRNKFKNKKQNEEGVEKESLIGDYRDLENLQPGYGGGHNIDLNNLSR